MGLTAKFRRIRRSIRRNQTRFLPYALSLVVVILHGITAGGELSDRIDALAQDALFQLRGPNRPPRDVVVIGIDEKIYQRLNLSNLEPPPRNLYTTLIHRLRGYEAKLVFFDLIFRSPGKNSQIDEEFAQSLKLVPSFIGKYVKLNQHIQLDGSELVQEEWHLPLDLFQKNVSGVVALNLELDNGVVRRFPRVDPTLPFTPLASLLCPKLNNCPDFPGWSSRINFYGPPGSLRTISLGEVLADEDGKLSQYFRGKIVLVGIQLLTQAGIENRDTFYTPYSQSQTFGVEIHGTILGNLLERDWLRRLDPRIESALTNVMALLLSLSLFSQRPTKGMILLLLFMSLWAAVAYVAFLRAIFLSGAFLVFVILPLAFVFSTLYQFIVYRQSLNRIELALGLVRPLSRS